MYPVDVITESVTITLLQGPQQEAVRYTPKLLLCIPTTAALYELQLGWDFISQYTKQELAYPMHHITVRQCMQPAHDGHQPPGQVRPVREMRVPFIAPRPGGRQVLCSSTFTLADDTWQEAWDVAQQAAGWWWQQQQQHQQALEWSWHVDQCRRQLLRLQQDRQHQLQQFEVRRQQFTQDLVAEQQQEWQIMEQQQWQQWQQEGRQLWYDMQQQWEHQMEKLEQQRQDQLQVLQYHWDQQLGELWQQLEEAADMNFGEGDEYTALSNSQQVMQHHSQITAQTGVARVMGPRELAAPRSYHQGELERDEYRQRSVSIGVGQVTPHYQ